MMERSVSVATHDIYGVHREIYDRFVPTGEPRGFRFSQVIGDPKSVVIRERVGPPGDYQVGDVLTFALRAMPMMGITGRRKQIPPGSRYDTYRLLWIKRKAAGGGFELLKVGMKVEPAEVAKPGSRWRLNAVIYGGVLRVADADAFNAALRNGVGRGATYGCGLLMVRAIEG